MADAHLARSLHPAGPVEDPVIEALPVEEDRLAALLEYGLGMSPSPHMLAAFVHQTKMRARALGIEEHSYIRMLELGGSAARAEWMAVAPALTVGETFLFRDTQLWNLIECTLLPQLAALAKPVWLWSAGCSTGEEAYTLGIVARRSLGEQGARILGTDVNPKAIAAARVGVYGQWSLRGVDTDRRDGLTINGTQTVRVHDGVKSMVRFETHNLNDETAYPPHGLASFELIVCRNVLIYMSIAARAKIIHALTECVTPGGLLILGHGEAAGIDLGDLIVERHDAGVVFRRPLVPIARPLFIDMPAPKPAPKRSVAAKRKTAAVDRKGRPLHTTSLRDKSSDKISDKTSVVLQAKLAHRTGEAAPVDGRSHNKKCREYVASAIREARAGKLENAERSALAAIGADSLDPEPHVLLAALQMARGALREAETELRRALFLDPVFVPALWQIGNLYGITERKRQAAYSFARALTQLEGLPPETEALPFDNLSVGELSTLLRAELGERVEA